MKINGKLKAYVYWIILITVVVLLPLIFKNPYIINTMVFAALYGVLAMGSGALMGQAGLLSLAQPTWFGLGAYCAGILAVREITPPWLSIIIGVIFVTLLSFIIGLPVLRLKGVYLACVTLGILMISQIVFIHLPDFTGGSSGLKGVPALSIFGFVFKKDIHFYFLSWALCLGSLLFFSNIFNSRVGRAIKASADSELASTAMGVDIPKHRMEIFILTSASSAMAGGIYCYFLRFVAPGMFNFAILLQLVLMMTIGGIRILWGPLLGSLVLTWVGELIHLYLGKYFTIMTGGMDAIFFAILVIFMLILLPDGLAGWIMRLPPFRKKAL